MSEVAFSEGLPKNIMYLFDLDGTLTSAETLPLIGRKFNLRAEIETLTRETVEGRVPFVEGFIKRVNLLKNLDIRSVSDSLASVELNSEILKFIKEHRGSCAVVTGNFIGWVESILGRIPCAVHASKGVEGIQGSLEITEILRKEEVVKHYQSQGYFVVFVGDGNNDAEAIRLSDVGIACGIVHEPAASVLSVADYVIYDSVALVRLLSQIREPLDGLTVIVPAAGIGSRLGLGMTKSLVKILGKSLIERQLSHLKDVEDLRVVIGYESKAVVSEVLKFRSDVVFVFNHEYFATKSGFSLFLGSKYARDFVLLWDGDLIVHPGDITGCINAQFEYLGVSEVSSEDSILVQTDSQENVVRFSKSQGAFEWTGPAMMRRERVKENRGDVFEMLEDSLPLPAMLIRAMDVDTSGDVRRAEEFVATFGMNNEAIHSYYKQLASKITNPLETRNKSPDFSEFDVELVMDFLGPFDSLLDLGAGTGLVINKLSTHRGNITAVEKYPEFSAFIAQREGLSIVEEDLLSFSTDLRFNLVTAFGVMNFFSTQEAKALYSRILNWTHPGGTLIVKHQMGLDRDVSVGGWSEELQAEYYSNYRSLDSERALLLEAGFVVKETRQMYPPEYNRWDDTKFFALICSNPL